jgi:hypothetical protein
MEVLWHDFHLASAEWVAGNQMDQKENDRDNQPQDGDHVKQAD